ncbi:DNA recombination protein RmuC [Buchananella hordeovulneris]|uniref:DNA recombination protein RmuC n=1 Tax=Buchananella hordeovulneris TaxID=52770 RepID=UPI000F5E55D0|nr:DNA recombination protein RmuC [Buchananella hordeovulneris]RRD51059.1 DNA recombination protein RmuC [Buchananella hordeovulneris]
MTFLEMFFLLLVLLMGAAGGWFAGRKQAQVDVARARSAVAAELGQAQAEAAAQAARAQALAGQLDATARRASHDNQILATLSPISTVLSQLGARVEGMERQRVEQFTTLATRLEEATRTDAELLRATRSLDGALRATRARGLWGETALRRIVEAAGMLEHVDFSEQVAAASVGGSGSGRPDVTVHLPGGGHLAIDAKVPLDAYLAAAESGTVDDAAARAHAKALRGHVTALAGRDYPHLLGAGPQLTVLFLPAEPLLAVALQADPTLLEAALAQGISLATPATLLAILKATATVWAQEAARADAEKLLAVGRTLYDRLGKVAAHLDSVGAHLTKTVGAYNRAVSSFESRLLVTAREVNTLSQAHLQVTELDGEQVQVRAFTRPELTAHLESTDPAASGQVSPDAPAAAADVDSPPVGGGAPSQAAR